MLKLTGIKKSFRIAGKKQNILKGVDLHLKKGEVIALTGKSGSGKSTILSIIAGLTRADHGEIRLLGKAQPYFDIFLSKARSRHIGFIFQTFRLLQSLSVKENIVLAARIAGNGGKHVQKEAVRLLEMLEMSDFIHSPVGLLSGGQKQRIAIARALINDPEIVLADEPTANLDGETSHEIFHILKNLQKDGKTILIVTHKKEMLKKAGRIYRLENGVLERDE